MFALLTALVLLPVATYFLVKLPAVQTWLVRSAMGILAEHVSPATVRVGSVHYSFFTKLVLEDVYVSDVRGDTLLYVKELAASFSKLNFSKKRAELQFLRMRGGVFNLYNYALEDGDSSTNIKDIVQRLKKDRQAPDTVNTEGRLPWRFRLNGLELDDFRFTFRNYRKPTPNPDPRVIDFKNLDIRHICLQARNLRLYNDTLYFDLEQADFTERCGYRIEKLTANNCQVSGTQTLLHDVELQDNHSHLFMRYYKMDYEDVRSFNDYETDVRMEAAFNDALFSFRTIAYMAKNFKLTPTFRLTGVVSGPVASLRSEYLQITSESLQTRIATKFRLTGLPDINETMMQINIARLSSTMSELPELLQGFVAEDTLNLQWLEPLENINLRGSFTGMYNDFVLKGSLAAAIGEADFDISLDIGHRNGQGIQLKGDVQAHQLNIGKLLHAAPTLGEVTGTIVADGTIMPAARGGITLNTTGHLSRTDFMHYAYKNIDFKGLFHNADYDGIIRVNDPNLVLTFNGYIKALEEAGRGTLRNFNFSASVDFANLSALHLNPRDSISMLRAQVKADYALKTLYEGTGSIAITRIKYAGNKGFQDLGDILFRSDCDASGHRASLRSDFLEADYMAPESLEAFVDNAVELLVERQLPELYSDAAAKKDTFLTDFTLKAVCKAAEKVTDILLPGLYIAPGTAFEATLTSHDSLSLRLSGQQLAWNNNRLKAFSLTAYNGRQQSRAVLQAEEATTMGFTMKNITSLLSAHNNVLDVELAYNNKTAVENRGKLSAEIIFTRNDGTGQLLSDLYIRESQLVVNDSVWYIAPADVLFGNKIHISDFHLHNNRQAISVNGVLSNSPFDTLTVVLNHFDVANINYLTEQQGYSFNGFLSGSAQIVDVYHTPRFLANVNADHIAINNKALGSLSVRGFWQNDEKVFRLRAIAQQDTIRPFEITGYYSPARKYIDFSALFNCFQLSHAEPLLNGLLTDISGCLSGQARVHGSLNNLQLEGTNLHATDVAATVDYLQTRYLFNTPVLLSSTRFGFENAEVTDNFGGNATLSVLVHHKNFNHLQYDVAAYPRNLCVMNTTEKDNALFYGRAFATGAAHIKGDANDIQFDINLKTERNTVIHIPASSSGQARDLSLLSFVQPEKNAGEDAPDTPPANTRKPANLDIELNVNVTPDTEIQLELDKQAGDVIRSYGAGDIKIEVNPATAKFSLYGDYQVDRGDYLFRLQNFNLISKKFYLEQGGRITFNGDLRQTVLNLKALYKTKASLNSLLADTSSVTTRRPVDCTIDITGNMFSPTLSLGIDVQNLDAETRARLQSALNTEEKVTRQFLALLAFGSFMPDQEMDIGTGFWTGSATELLSNQINNLLSQVKFPLGIGLDLGFTYMPSQQGRDEAFDFNFSAQIWDNRVVINGNVGSGNNQQVVSNDFDADIRLGAKGKWHFKAFTRSVDQYTDNVDNSQRYGVGLMYKEEFNSFSELFKRLFGRKKKPARENEPATKAPEPAEETSP